MTDSFANLSLKVIESFSWAAKMLNADVIVKTDDDSFVNIEPFLDTIGPGIWEIFGGCNAKVRIVNFIWDPFGKEPSLIM
jgi:hypothetical protein